MNEPPPSSDDTGLPRKLSAWQQSADSLDRKAVFARVQQELFDASETPLEVGRFVVSERLGAGATGVVYSAYDPKLDRHIALKVLRQQSDQGPQTTDRLLREAQTLARLSHPHVVAVHDVGDVDGRIFIAMELLPGGTLRQWLRDSSRSVSQILSVFCQAGEGLAAAHESGVVHRDFKPDNVMLDERGRARVVDFGLAREQAEPGMSMVEMLATDDHPVLELEARLTETGAILGTPAYMAPEQLQGRRADARADQFAFCVALYEALYRERPFAGKTLPALSLAIAQGEVSPAPPGTRVPPRLRRALLMGLRADPKRRHPSMAALVAMLRHDPTPRRRRALLGGAALIGAVGITWALADAPTSAAPVCTGFEEQLVDRWDEPRRSAVRSALETLPDGASMWAQVGPRFDEYAEHWVSRRQQACEATERGQQSAATLDRRVLCLDRALLALDAAGARLLEAEREQLDRVHHLVPQLRWIDACNATEVLDDGIPPSGDQQLRDRLREIEVDVARAASLRIAGRYPEALQLATDTAKRAEALGHPPTLARALREHGNGLSIARRRPEAIEVLSRGNVAAERGRADRTRIKIVMQLAQVLAESGEFDEARRWAALSDAMLDRLAERPASGDFGQHILWGDLALEEGDYAEAITRFEQALASPPPIEPSLREEEIVAAHNRLGLATMSSGDPAGALEFFQESLRRQQLRLGDDHPGLAAVHDNVGAALYKMRQYDRAAEHFEAALRLRERWLGPEHEMLAAVHSNLAALAIKRGRLPQAIESLRKAMKLIERSLGPDSAELAGPMSNLAIVHIRRKEFAEAIELNQRALRLRTKGLGQFHPRTLDSLYQLAYAHQNAGDLSAARELYEQYLALCLEHTPDATIDVVMTRVALTDIALRQQRVADAYELARAAHEALGDSASFNAVRSPATFNLARTLHALGRRPSDVRSLAAQARAAGSPTEVATIDEWLAEQSIELPPHGHSSTIDP